MIRSKGYIQGSFWRISDRSGLKMRAEDSVEQWNGLIVHRDEAEPRHPQDFVKGKADKQSVPNARPREAATFIGPLMTAVDGDHSAGDTTISVDTSSRFTAGDTVVLYLKSGDVFRTTLFSIPSATSIRLDAALLGAVADNSSVVDLSAVTEPTYPDSGGL